MRVAVQFPSQAVIELVWSAGLGNTCYSGLPFQFELQFLLLYYLTLNKTKLAESYIPEQNCITCSSMATTNSVALSHRTKGLSVVNGKFRVTNPGTLALHMIILFTLH